tara:strand:- start:1 stop:1536 length:1536 start_codon:yes stop_codon:yes gene_type:complete
MAILRYTASADTTITNAFEANLSDRGTGSNMGYADSLEIFSIYGQTSSSANGQSQELSRALIKFPVSSVVADRTAGTIPAAGSVSFYLRMFNARTPFTLPQGFNLVIAPVSRSWDEGTGLDMDDYQDLGVSNWISSSTGTPWSSVGGDYRTGSNYNVSFPLGYEDIDLDVTTVVEKWIAGTDPAFANNYGFGVRLTASQEAYYSSSTGLNNGSLIHNPQGARVSNYTKKFFSRSTEFFFKRPVLEARWDSRVQDDRENFFYSSSLAPSDDNLNTLYLYNYVRGRLVNIPAVGAGPLSVSFYSSSTSGTPSGNPLNLAAGGDVVTALDTNATASFVSTGIYSCSVALTAATTRLTAIHDVWHNNGVQFFTGSFYPELMPTYDSAPTFDRVTSCTNLRKTYLPTETARFRFFVRSKDWSPTVYTVATANNPTDIITSASYNIRRVIDNYNAVPYGTGSDLSTYMSYDKQGNYFDLDMGLLASGYMYEINLSYYNDSIGAWQEQPQTFKFRVEE